MKYSIIGTGNMAWFLAKRMKQAGHECLTVSGRDPLRAAELADAVQGRVAPDMSPRYRDGADVVLLAVSDDALPLLAPVLDAGRSVVIHTAGSVSPDVLTPAAHRAVLWPVYSIVRDHLPAHRDIPCAWEAATPHARHVTEQVAHSFSDLAFETDTLQRRWLHLAAVVGNNFVNHLMAIDEAICTAQGLSFQVLQPILQQTFARTASAMPSSLQTGPAARHDTGTIEKHLALLEAHPEWAAVYRALTESIWRKTAD